MKPAKNIDLMKFAKINDFLKMSLKNETFYATPLHKLNDPIEQITLVGSQIPIEGESFNTNFKNSCGVYCVTEFSNKHFSGPLLPMWAHYGDNHQGVCLVIRTKESKKNEWIKVEYIDSTQTQTLDPKGKSQLQMAREVLSYKLKPWSTEKEYRLVLPPEEAGHSHSWTDFFELKKIIFGYKCTPEQINELICHFSNDLSERVQLNYDDGNFLDLLQVREPLSAISDLAPFRIALARDSLRISGHSDTYPNNKNQFYPLGTLYKGQIPICYAP
jgi:hypothetical protein